MTLANILGGVVTVMGNDGKPMQIPAAALQAGGMQNIQGKIPIVISLKKDFQELSKKSQKGASILYFRHSIIHIYKFCY